MAVILDPTDYGSWLGAEHSDREADKATLQALLKPTDPSGWEAYPISLAVNKPANDSPELLEPLAAEAP